MAKSSNPQHDTHVESPDEGDSPQRRTHVELAGEDVASQDNTHVEPADSAESPSRQTYVEPAEAGDSPARNTFVEPGGGGDSPLRQTYVEPVGEDASLIRKTVCESAFGEGPFGQASLAPRPLAESPEQTMAPRPVSPAGPQPVGSSVKRFRPSERPPIARLLVLDDAGDQAEVFRIRTETFQIGRSKGDCTIRHDGQMSSSHAEIYRKLKYGFWQWRLKDLKSTNGTFVRITEAVLHDRQELFIGGHMYEFRVKSASDDKRKAGDDSKARSGTSLATLVEMNPDGDKRRFPLQKDQWLGRDENSCAIVIDDPLIGNKEVRFACDDEGKWFVKSGRSLNGVWARMNSVVIQSQGVQFQCGEQRFQVQLD